MRSQWQQVHACVCVAHERYECFGVVKQESGRGAEVYMVTANQCLADAEQSARRIWHYKSAVPLDKMVKFVICALDDCFVNVPLWVALLVDPANEAIAE